MTSMADQIFTRKRG